jgi:hypothetical protein
VSNNKYKPSAIPRISSSLLYVIPKPLSKARGKLNKRAPPMTHSTTACKRSIPRKRYFQIVLEVMVLLSSVLFIIELLIVI